MCERAVPGQHDDQVPKKAWSAYADPLMEVFEEAAWPEIETVIGDELWPTYSYCRVYHKGAVLAPHKDRGSCELSVSICLGADHGENAAGDADWPLRLTDRSGEERAARMRPGDAVVYQGCDLSHWRDRFEGEWQCQVFLHFVRRDGPFGQLARFDCRPSLGLPATARDPHRRAQVTKLEQLREYTLDKRGVRPPTS